MNIVDVKLQLQQNARSNLQPTRRRRRGPRLE
jgi:hypothetical protein